MAPYNPPDAHYNEISMKECELWKKNLLLESGGKFLYQMTHKLGLKYVWYNTKRDVIELWGPYKAFTNGARDKFCMKLSELVPANAPNSP